MQSRRGDGDRNPLFSIGPLFASFATPEHVSARRNELVLR